MFIERIDGRLDYEKLIEYGFSCKEDELNYSVGLKKSGLILNLKVLKNNEIQSELIDPDSQSEYLLHKILDFSGAYISQVREEYQEILDAITTFASEEIRTKRGNFDLITALIAERYQVSPDYLWENSPETAAFRHLKTKKWFGLITVVSGDKVGKDKSEHVPILVLRTGKGKAPELVDNFAYFPGYHMNKKNWITIIPDKLNPQELTDRIEESYRLTKGK